jgi:hypothetical protein
VRGADVEEPASVRAELLDRDLRSGGPECKRLPGHRSPVGVGHGLEQRHAHVRAKCLHYSLRNQNQGEYDRQGQQDVDDGACHINPEVADRRRFPPNQAAQQRHENCHARGGRYEVLHRQAEHLRQVAQRGFAAVVLPICVRDEADGCVEGQVRTHRSHAGGIQRQKTLQALQCVEEREPKGVEQEHVDGITLPARFSLEPHASDLVDRAFYRLQPASRPGRASLIDRRHVRPERLYAQEQNARIKQNLIQLGGWHVRTTPVSASRRTDE